MGLDDEHFVISDIASSEEDPAAEAARLEAAAEMTKRLDELMLECVKREVSDLHIAPDSLPYYRESGVLEPQEEHEVISAEEVELIAGNLLDGAQRKALRTKGAADGAISSSDGSRFRFNVFKRQGELSIALRRLDDRFRSLAELGLPESLYNLCDKHDGLVIVAGPTGAGKSTTLAALIDRINRKRRSHIVTIEDPVEYVHKPIKSLINQRQVGTDASSFNEALVASLRQDPDVILVGEIREIETIRTAITAAETGHLVFATVHASDCVGAVERLISVFPADEQEGMRRQLALVLRAVVTQHLLAAIPQKLPQKSAGKDKEAGAEDEPPPRQRVSASEVLIVTPAVSNMIATAKSAQIYSAMESSSAAGMQTLEQDLARLWANNLISESAAVAMAKNPDIVRDRVSLLRRRGGKRTVTGNVPKQPAKQPVRQPIRQPAKQPAKPLQRKRPSAGERG